MTYVDHDRRYWCSFCGHGPTRDGVEILCGGQLLAWACPKCISDPEKVWIPYRERLLRIVRV